MTRVSTPRCCLGMVVSLSLSILQLITLSADCSSKLNSVHIASRTELKRTTTRSILNVNSTLTFCFKRILRGRICRLDQQPPPGSCPLCDLHAGPSNSTDGCRPSTLAPTTRLTSSSQSRDLRLPRVPRFWIPLHDSRASLSDICKPTPSVRLLPDGGRVAYFAFCIFLLVQSRTTERTQRGEEKKMVFGI